MEFLNVGLLPYFLPFVAIPIILHLFTLYRLKTVELSTFRFLFDSYVQQRRKMKFLEAIIALLRTLFLLLLVLCVARPIIKHWSALFSDGSSARDIVLLVDSSASMDVASDGRTSHQRAKQAARRIIDHLGPDDRVTLINVSSKPTEICSRFSSDAQAILSELEKLDVTPSRANYFATFSHLFGADSTELTNPVIYLFTDSQSSGWSEFADGESGRIVPEQTELVVVNVGSTAPLTNRAIVAGAPEKQQAIVGLPVKLNPVVANYSQESANLTIKMYLDEKEVARTQATIPPGEADQLEFLYTPTHAGILRGRYTISEDGFAEDNSFLFALDVSPRVSVLLVNGNPSPQPLENDGLYLRTAMVATDPDPELLGDDPEDPLIAENRELVRALDVIDLPEPNLNQDVLRDVRVVILANCGALKKPQFDLLCNFVRQGGGLIILPGSKVNPKPYNEQLLVAPMTPDEQLISAKLGEVAGNPEDETTFERFDGDAIDFSHPVLSVFSDQKQRYFTKVSVYKRFRITLAAEQGEAWPLLQLSNGEPALVEGRYGTGKVMLSAIPFHTSWSNVPLKPEFVPLVLRMISHTKQLPEVAGPSVVAADGSAEIVVSQAWSPASAKVTDVQGRVTPVLLQRSNSMLKGAFDQTNRKGFYQVDVSGGRTEQPRRASLSFAVNLAPGESDFEAYNKQQIQELIPQAKIKVVDASAEAQQLYGSIGDEREIWRPLILLLFVIIAVEFLLATLGGRSIDGEPQPTVAQRLRGVVRGNWAKIEEMQPAGPPTDSQ